MIRLTDEERLQEREEGRQEGIEQGKKNKALEIALNLLNRNIPLSDISQITGLSEKEIEKLQVS